jgi:hypothetical protein
MRQNEHNVLLDVLVDPIPSAVGPRRTHTFPANRTRAGLPNRNGWWTSSLKAN